MWICPTEVPIHGHVCMYADVKCPCPRKSDTTHSMNEHIVAGLCGIMILGLGKTPPGVPPAYDLRQHRPPRGPSTPRQVRWRNDFDDRPLQLHRRGKSWVDGEVGWYLHRPCMRRWWRSLNRAGETAWRFGGQEPQLRRVAWNNRPRRRDVTNLTGVSIGGVGGAQST